MIKITRSNGPIKLELPDKDFLYIYSFKNKKSGKHYIGSTSNIEVRVSQHLDGCGSQPLLKDLVNYGRKSFDITILDYIIFNNHEDRKRIERLEDKYIIKYNAINNGYNLRLNRKHMPSNVEFNLHSFDIRAKFNFIKGDSYIFSVGSLSLYLEYEKCMALSVPVSRITHRNNSGNEYYSLSINIEEEDQVEFEKCKIYNLKLAYNQDNGTLILLNYTDGI